MESKKAQGISINAIIIAALALIVLVVLIAVFTGQFGNWGLGLDQTTNPTCTSDTHEPKLSSECSAINTLFGKYKDVSPGYVCCKKTSD